MMKKKFTIAEIEEFVHDHIQSKILNNELSLIGLDMDDPERSKAEFEIYKNALTEGIINGIIMCDQQVEGIDA